MLFKKYEHAPEKRLRCCGSSPQDDALIGKHGLGNGWVSYQIGILLVSQTSSFFFCFPLLYIIAASFCSPDFSLSFVSTFYYYYYLFCFLFCQLLSYCFHGILSCHKQHFSCNYVSSKIVHFGQWLKITCHCL